MSDLQSQLILLQNTQNLDEIKVTQILGKDISSFVEDYIGKQKDDTRWHQKILLFISKLKTNLGEKILQIIEKGEDEFYLQLLSNLIDQDSTPIVLHFEEIAFKVGANIEHESTSVSQVAIRVLTKLLLKVDQLHPDVFAAKREQLVEKLL